MVLWKKELDPFVTVYMTDTSSFTPVILELPNISTTIHIALYLPTAGQDSYFIAELSKLRIILDELIIKYSDPIIFIRGDANSSSKNRFRSTLFSSLCKDYTLTRIPINHFTYHHFVGGGLYDSDLDVILHSTVTGAHEELTSIHCRNEEPSVDSHHDLLVSEATLPHHREEEVDKSENIKAPRIPNTRQKIIWSEEGIELFSQITAKLLPDIRDRWKAESKACLSVLLQATNFLLSHASSESNKVVSLASSAPPIKSRRIPKEIKKSGNTVAKAH